MNRRRIVCMVTALVLAVGFSVTPANAATKSDNLTHFLVAPYATGAFEFQIPGDSQAQSQSFRMLEGESVTINATYTPIGASVDFGLVDSNGIFHYINTSNGSIDKTIIISKSDRYTLQVRNNSSSTIDVSGDIFY